MLTTRGLWLFLAVLTCLGTAFSFYSIPLILICLTLLLWFFWQWLDFHLRLGMAARHLRVERRLRVARGEVHSLWSGQQVAVDVALHLERGTGLPLVLAIDRLPPLAVWKTGELQQDGALEPGRPLRLAYQIHCPNPGKLRFDGLAMKVVDLQGFFVSSRFVHAVAEVRVLPALFSRGRQTPLVKQQNILPLLGSHRHARPGSGSELLELRDYHVGDPPKQIAWKVSARRDRLITKEYENEVPVRCTLFLDTSASARLGPPGRNALVRLVEISAAVAQSAAAQRDLVGVSFFDETGVTQGLRPGRGPHHALRLLGALSDAAALLPRHASIPLPTLLRYAYGLAQDVYPDWLREDLNHLPFWWTLWAPQPSWTRAPASAPARGEQGERGVRGRLMRWLRSRPPRRPWRFSPAYAEQVRWRKQLAAILAIRFELGPGGISWLLEDDAACSRFLQDFLAEHQVPVPAPLYDDAGRFTFSTPGKLEVLGQALLHAVRHGKDNELFVLCADLLDDAELERLEQAVGVARARHHQVLVVIPWPPGIEAPGTAPAPLPPAAGAAAVGDWVLHATTARLHAAFAQVKQRLARRGVAVLCARQADAVDLILARMDRMRTKGTGIPR